MVGCLQTSVHLERCHNRRRSTPSHNSVHQPHYSSTTTYHPPNSIRRAKVTHFTSARRAEHSSHDLHRSCHPGRTIHQKGRNPLAIPTIRKSFQRKRITTLPSVTSL